MGISRRSLILLIFLIFNILHTPTTSAASSPTPTPTPTPWPLQFHSILFANYSGELSLIDLWYDWPKGRNFNIIQDQLGGPPLYDLEWNNGTSYYYTLPQGGQGQGSDDDVDLSCKTTHFDVGILRPNWMDGGNYLGQKMVDGFLCNVWEKVDFIWYYEDVATKRPVLWIFYTGRTVHVMTFEVGAVLEDAKWQAPVYCFDNENKRGKNRDRTAPITSKHFAESLMQKRNLRATQWL